MLRFGYELRGTVVADLPHSPGQPDLNTVIAVEFWHQQCSHVIDVMDNNILDKLRHSQYNDPCLLCRALPEFLPDNIDARTLVPHKENRPCERCNNLPSTWLHLPLSPPTYSEEHPKPHWHYFCGNCLAIPEGADLDSNEVQAAAVTLELDRRGSVELFPQKR